VIAVKVIDADCRPGSVVLDEYVVLPEIGAKDRIEWRLPPGYHFCTNSGDGVFLKDPNAPQDVFEHNPRPHCSDTFEWKRKRGDRRDYEYYLRFRSASNICVRDPWMRN